MMVSYVNIYYPFHFENAPSGICLASNRPVQKHRKPDDTRYLPHNVLSLKQPSMRVKQQHIRGQIVTQYCADLMHVFTWCKGSLNQPGGYASYVAIASTNVPYDILPALSVLFLIYSCGVQPFCSLKHLLKYDTVPNPTS